MLKITIKSGFGLKFGVENLHFSVKCGFLLKLSLKHTLTHNFNLKFNLKSSICVNFDDIFIFQRNPWILRICNKFSIIWQNPAILSKAWNFWDLSHDFLAVFRKISKKAGETLRKQQFQVKSFGFVPTRTRRVYVCMLAHMYIVLCARVSRVWEPARRWIFGKSPKFYHFGGDFSKFLEKQAFLFLAGRRPSPKG